MPTPKEQPIRASPLERQPEKMLSMAKATAIRWKMDGVCGRRLRLRSRDLNVAPSGRAPAMLAICEPRNWLFQATYAKKPQARAGEAHELLRVGSPLL
jgi:hypothetical protein